MVWCAITHMLSGYVRRSGLHCLIVYGRFLVRSRSGNGWILIVWFDRRRHSLAVELPGDPPPTRHDINDRRDFVGVMWSARRAIVQEGNK